MNLKQRTYSIFDLCEFQAVSMGSRDGLSTIHGFVAWCYDEIKSMLNIVKTNNTADISDNINLGVKDK